jgi:AcrR family transcriptional regulator
MQKLSEVRRMEISTNVRAILSGQMIFSIGRQDKGSRRSGSFTQGERTRQTILAGAVKIAAREGLAAVTIGRLAKELRMSKSGLISHFGSKHALELATLETARRVFADAVIRPAQDKRGGIERVWNFCDLWLQHIEQQIFAGPYFFTGTFLEHVDQRGPIAEAVTAIAQEWFNALRKAVEEAQEKGEINPKAGPKQITWELNGLLVGAQWAYLLKHGDCWRQARPALLGQLRKLATSEIPPSAFMSERNWKKYLQRKS